MALLSSIPVAQSLEWSLLRRREDFYPSVKDIFIRVMPSLYKSEGKGGKAKDWTRPFQKIADREDRLADILLINKEPKAMLAYKIALENVNPSIGNSLRLKACFIFDLGRSELALQNFVVVQSLMNRMQQVAVDKGASYMHMVISEVAKSQIDFLCRNGFVLNDLPRGKKLLSKAVIYRAPTLVPPEMVKSSPYEPRVKAPEVAAAPVAVAAVSRKPPLAPKRQRDGEGEEVRVAAELPKDERRLVQGEDPIKRQRGRIEEARARYEVGEAVPAARAKSAPPPFMPKTHSIPLKRQYLYLIANGRKTVEGRINTGQFRSIRAGDSIQFFSGEYKVPCRVTEVKTYKTFEEMLRAVGVEKCLPGVKNLADGVGIYNAIPGYRDKAALHGVLAFSIQLTA